MGSLSARCVAGSGTSMSGAVKRRKGESAAMTRMTSPTDKTRAASTPGLRISQTTAPTMHPTPEQPALVPASTSPIPDPRIASCCLARSLSPCRHFSVPDGQVRCRGVIPPSAHAHLGAPEQPGRRPTERTPMRCQSCLAHRPPDAAVRAAGPETQRTCESFPKTRVAVLIRWARGRASRPSEGVFRCQTPPLPSVRPVS